MPIATEHVLFYAVVCRDAMIVLPHKLRDLADATRWPKDLNQRARIQGREDPRKTAQILMDLHPQLFQGVSEPLDREPEPLKHTYNVETHEGMLPQLAAEALITCKQKLSGFMANQAPPDPALYAMGLLAHRIIDLFNPFSLATGNEEVEEVGKRFMSDLVTYYALLPYKWPFINEECKALDQSPFSDPMTVSIEAERRYSAYFNAIGDCYIAGNGYPAARPAIEEWYQALCTALSCAWLHCAR